MNVLVVGSSLIDLFVDLEQNAKVSVTDDSASFKLGDKIPVGIKSLSLGGNGGNVSAGLKKLGIDTSFYTYLGSDVLSSYIKQVMQNEDVRVIAETEEVTTGSLSIILNFGSDRVILSHHNASNHSFDRSKIAQKPDIIFLTSIGKEWKDAYKNVLSFAHENGIPIALSPGSEQLKDVNETFIQSVHQSKMLLCNREEAQMIVEKLSGKTPTDAKELLAVIKTYGFELLSITDGENGAYAMDISDTIYKIPSLKPDGNEKTGAGDGYAAAFLASYLNGLDVYESMKRGVINSVSVMSKIGAHTGQLRLDAMEEKAEQAELKAEVI